MKNYILVPTYLLVFSCFGQGKLTLHTPKGFKDIIEKQNINYFDKSKEEKIGFRIQLYNGKDRQKALEIKYKFNKEFEGIDADIIHETPQFKTVAGYYGDWKQASKALEKISEKFQNALIKRVKFKRIKLFEDNL